MKKRRILVFLALLPVVLGCPGEEVVKLGAVLPLTGEAAIYGLPVQRGVELAFEHFQSQQDLPYQLELVVVDSESDPEKAKNLLIQVYRDGALASIGGVTTAEALQMVAVADEFDRVLISPSASTPQLSGISKNFYRVFPSDAREGATMGNFATQKLKAEKVVILAKEDAYAKGIQQVFKTEFERYGGEVLDLIEFPSLGSELSGLVERVMTLGPDAVYLAAYAADLAQMIKHLRDQGYKGTIFTTSAFAAPEIIAQVGRPAEGVFLTQAVFDIDSEDPVIRNFIDGYRAKYNLEPDLYAAHGYDSVMVLVEALRIGGRTSSELWKGIRSIRDFSGATGTVQFDERGDVQKFPRVYVVNEGVLVDYEAEVERRRRELLERLRDLEKEQRRTRSGD
ncbi:MAG: ABC transporter substrate-binding protein [Thermoanaerobaculia bacterium]